MSSRNCIMARFHSGVFSSNWLGLNLVYESKAAAWDAIHQLLSIILKSRILVLLSVTHLSYVA
jgi:hypothetical protein